MVFIHVALRKCKAILCPKFSVLKVKGRVKEISFKNRIPIADLLDICMTVSGGLKMH
jgi:hypothetical protein